MTNNTVEDLIKEREETHGEAWIQASMMSRVVNLDAINKMNFLYAFLVILSKLARIAKAPTNIDHWKDIAGYATLVFQYLEANATRNDDEIPF